MSVYGKEGMRELALQNVAKTQYAAQSFVEAGASLRFSGARFNEVVVSGLPHHSNHDARLRAEHIVGGLDLGRFYPELAGDRLFCFTETATRENIDRLVGICTGREKALSVSRL